MNNEYKNSLGVGYMKYRVSQIILLIILMMSSIIPLSAWAACSSQINLATINELNSNNRNNIRFLEIKVLDSSLITSGEYLNWNLRLCRQSGGSCTSLIPVSNASLSNAAYLVIDGRFIPRGYGDYSNGLEVSLFDSNGDIIDYLSVGDYSDLGRQGCTGFAFDTTAPTSNTLDLRRNPDGTGDWDYEPGNSGGSTEGDTNDGEQGFPALSFDDIQVEPGQDAIVTLSLSDTSGDAIIFNYTTFDGTASAGSDYVATTGSVTIPAGDTTATFTITTLPGATVGEFFNFFISVADSSPGIATITDHTGTVTFYAQPTPLGEWRFEEPAWSGVSGEVTDSSGNGLDATSYNGALTSQNSPPGSAITGDPGTCRYGSFDGNNDYVQLPSSFPNLTGSFTITAWINPDRISGDQRILVDDENNNNGYAFSLGDGGDGRLRLFSRRVNPVVVDTRDAVISSGQWHHVAAVHNVNNRTRQIYVDGVAVRLDNNSFVSTYTGTWGADPGLASIGGETNNAGSEAVPRWRFDGEIDEVRVYSSALSATEITTVMNETHPCSNITVDHFDITVGGSASTCVPQSVTITALDSANNVLTQYTGGIQITTSSAHGNWSATDANGNPGIDPPVNTVDNTAPDDGEALYLYDANDQGSIDLFLSNTHADDLTITVADLATGSASISSVVSFRDNAFVISPVTCTGSSCPVTGSTEIVAGRGHQFTAELWARDAGTGDCAIATAYDTASNPAYGQLQAWISRDVSDPMGSAPSIGATILSSAAPGVNNLNLGFSSGVANFTLGSSDVGKYYINLRDDSSGFATSGGAARTIDGSSDTLTVRPFAFGIYDVSSSGTLNPGGTATSGNGFTSAGEDFVATVGAYLWQAGDDVDNNGLPDNDNTDVTDNGLSLAFNATTLLSADTTPSSFTPTTGVAGAVGGTNSLNAFVAGVQTATALTYNEVGSMILLAQSNDFLNTAGVNVTGRVTGPVGRFYPHYFDVTNVTITPACVVGGFSYMDQPELGLQYNVEAHRKGGGITANYFTPGYNTGNVVMVAEDNNDGTDLSARLSNTGAATWTAGSYQINTTTAQFDRAATPDGPFDSLQLGVQVTDPDGAELQNMDMKADDAVDCVAATSCNARSLASTQMRYGRIEVVNAHGSELLPLTQSLTTAYYDGSGFVLNSLDSCTSLTVANIILSNDIETDQRDGTIQVGTGTVTVSIQNSPAAGGRLDVDLTAPGSPGYVDIQPDLSTATGADLPWLLFDWDGDAGTADEAPVGRATFGIFGGNPQQIYMQELY